jgi:aminoglycoside phosphotransferase
MCLQNAPNRPRNVLRKAPPQAKPEIKVPRNAMTSSLRAAIRQSTAKVTSLATKLVPTFLRRNKEGARSPMTEQTDQKGILKTTTPVSEAARHQPERSTLALAAATQVSLQASILKTFLSQHSDTSSSDSGSKTFSEASQTSTASEPPTPKQLSAPCTPAPAPKTLTEDEQHDLDFAPLRAIPSELFKSVLLKHVDPTNYFKNPRIHIQRRTEGASHHVVMLQFGPASFEADYVIKVPVTGTKELWNEERAHAMRCEAMLMKHMERTGIPVPQVRAVADNTDSDLGAPYILMRRVPGKGAHNLWFDYDDEEHLNVDCPSPELEKKRETFLRSLAHEMAKLQELQFDKIGMLDFGDSWKDCDNECDEPVIGPLLLDTVDDEQVNRLPFSSAHGFMSTIIEERWPANMTLAHIKGEEDNEEDIKELHQYRGIRKIIDIIFSSAPFASTQEKETFVIRHPDLDLQNILTDDEGHVTGIIDWDGAVTAPRCIGFSALPHFLVHDWHPGFSFDDCPHMSWSVDRYRRIYADAMKEALIELAETEPNGPGLYDGKYTYNSALYQAVWASVTRGGSPPDLVNKVLLSLPGLRLTDLDEFQERLGKGWDAAEQYLKVEIGKLMTPEE